MDWFKLVALLITIASIHIAADTPKKKIRIHLPQKVKHIHHHKKIYITNHPASSQYAPAFMPSAEGAVAVPTNIAMPAVASVELYDEPARMPKLSSAASKLLPLYRARGYYGPRPTEWDEQDNDISDHAETMDEYEPTSFAASPATPIAASNYNPKRVKIIKLKEPSRKPVVRKNKPKRVSVRHKQQPEVVEEEHPVTTFHEQFYSDLDGSGTIRTIKKPQRIEKIIDGDTEHIHTYSEEHVHKLVFNDGPKLQRVVGIDASASIPAIAAPHSILPLKNPQTLIAIPPDSLTKFSVVGSMGTPSQLEYTAYNPRDVTHDHIFHDHGELPSGVDLTKNHLSFPPRIGYSGQSIRLSAGAKGSKSKNAQKYLKAHPKPNPITDLSYFEQVYAPYNQFHNIQKLPISASLNPSHEEEIEGYRPVVPSFKFKSKGTAKARNIVPALYFGHGKQAANYRQQQSSASSPYSVSSTVVHEYKPKQYLGKSNKDTYSYPNNNYEYDTYASSSNIYTSDNYPQNFRIKKGKKKSVSVQNVSFGGLDHQTTVDHLEDSGHSGTSMNGVIPSAFDNNYDQPKLQQTVPTAFMIRESSQVHPYYSAMAMKAIHNGDQLSVAEASNDNYQYAEAPPPSTTSNEPIAATTAAASLEFLDVTTSEAVPTASSNYDTRTRNVLNSDVLNAHKDPRSRYKIVALRSKTPTSKSHDSGQNVFNTDSVSGKLKYGDKI